MVRLGDSQLYDKLLALDLIPEEKLAEVLKEAEVHDRPMARILLDRDLISEENLALVAADILGLPYIDLRKEIVDVQVLKLIPEVVAITQRVAAFKADESLHLAMADPTDLQLREFIATKAKLPLKIYVSSPQSISRAVALYRQMDPEQFVKQLTGTIKKTQKAKDELSIVHMVDELITSAIRVDSSDIHLEPNEEHVLVRFRTDGILHDIVKLPQELHQRIVTRIKVMAHLRTDEHSSAQDGKIEFKGDLGKADIRVSIVPTTNGEKVAMRLLSETGRHHSLTQLGLSEENLELIRQAYARPYGMILSTGPTGSGKTTSLYAILKLLNTREKNIMTIEDPVEYGIDGVNQIQVNPRTNLTFADGLRSIVRQDPDIILVGEIRDEETADIAINAALTGHLLLSSLHTNDAATTVPRLMEFGIKPFLIASTVNVILAQRLVRTICPKCRLSETVKVDDYKQHLSKEQIKRYFGKKKSARFYRGKGCSLCYHTGYLGRTGIFELMIISQRLRDAIMNQRDSDSIRQLALKDGMVSMFDDGLRKVEAGITTIEEIIRVVND
jgi:type IV pilus assembly protein PilB